jgi:hypothetical protein
MPYTVPAPADLAARFPAFAAVPAVTLAGAIAEAQTRVDTSWLPGDYTIAILLLAAHTLTLDGLGTGAEAAAAAAGTLGYASLRSGGLSLDRARAPRGAAEPSILAETTYGRRFLALLKVNQPAILAP